VHLLQWPSGVWAAQVEVAQLYLLNKGSLAEDQSLQPEHTHTHKVQELKKQGGVLKSSAQQALLHKSSYTIFFLSCLNG